jgi:hypothetical protein
MASKLNLAILIESEEISLWQYRILEKLFNTEYSHIQLFILKKRNPQNENSLNLPLFYRFHENLDHFIFRRKIDFNKKINVAEHFKSTPIIPFSAKDTLNDFVNFNAKEILSYNIDLVLNFIKQNIDDELAGIARLGVLTYLISKQIDYISNPSCYWEVTKLMPEIEVSIQLKQAKINGNTEIFRSGILPYPNSININRNNAYELASLFIPRIIQRISTDGNFYISDFKHRHEKSDYEGLSDQHVIEYPSSVKALSNLLMIFFSFLKKKVLYHKIGRWFIFFKLTDNKGFLPPDPRTLKVLQSPQGKFWADPFVISRDGHYYVFVEEYVYRTKKAHISVLTLDEKGKLLKSETIIDKPYHMSYPHVFMYEDSYYMIPETGSNKTIELYRCIRFPNEWVFERNIMENIHAKDSTIFFFNNKWWLFVSIIEKTNASMSFNELFLFYADNLFSPEWNYHPMNPIVSDQKISRSAGAIFMHENNIYRPSQDCSGIYGRALNVNCITKLSETQYEEVMISKTEPLWDSKIKGIHTYNFNDKIILMDAFRFRRMPF